MSDHHHYGYADERHSHRGEYAEERHDHGYDYAEKYHRHYDDENIAQGLREDLGRVEERTRELESDLRDAFGRITKLEQTVSVYGDLLDVVRNKVYALEHGTRYEPEAADRDEEPQS